MQKPNNLQILEGSQAIAQTINNIKVDVVCAYPITPQTHIVEDLAKFKADGEADYEYVKAESEFAAASIVLGASATGARAYTATSSQGLLFMSEVLFNISGLRLPMVMTCANRAIGAPINIWNDHSDAMALRDCGWIMLFAENNQEAIAQHIMAYKITETTQIPVMVNVDGFSLTHTYEPVIIPTANLIKKYLGQKKNNPEKTLNISKPKTIGHLAEPAYYQEDRQNLHESLINSQITINQALIDYQEKIALASNIEIATINKYNNGLVEYYGPKNATKLIIGLGSMIGTIKDTVDDYNKNNQDKVAVIKIKCFRPFPYEALRSIINKQATLIVLDRAMSIGSAGPLALEIANLRLINQQNSFILGLGGREITKTKILEIIKLSTKKNNTNIFIK